MDPELKKMYDLLQVYFFDLDPDKQARARHQLRDYATAYTWGWNPYRVHRDHCKGNYDEWVIK